MQMMSSNNLLKSVVVLLLQWIIVIMSFKIPLQTIQELKNKENKGRIVKTNLPHKFLTSMPMMKETIKAKLSPK